MKTYNLVYSNKDNLREFINNNKIIINSNILVQVFTYSTEVSYIENVINEIKSLIKNVKIVGSTTGGEIIDCSILEKSTVISITQFESTSVDTAYIEYTGDSYAVGAEIAKKLVKDNTKVLILFSDGLITNGDDILEGIHSVNKDIVVAGGRAADYGYMLRTLCFNEEKILDNGGVVGAALSGDQLIVNNDYSFCWQPIGKIMTITKSIKDRIYTVDDVPIRKLYEKYLGKEVADSLPKSATEFPLIVLKDVNIGRVAFKEYEDGSLGFIGNVQQDDKVCFSYGNVDMVAQKSIEIFERLKHFPIETIFVYSCTARRVFMQKKIDFELVPLRTFSPTAGFFTYGEFFHSHSNNQLLNITTTILCLSERDNVNSNVVIDLKRKNETDNFVDDKDIVIIRTLSHLAQTVTNELEIMNKSLEIKNEELKENQNKMIEIQRMSSLGVLAAGIAHNLKTPLATISSSIITLEKTNNKIKDVLTDIGAVENIKYTDKINEIIQRIDLCLGYMNNIILAVKEQTIIDNAISNSFTIKGLIERIKVLMSCTVRHSKCKLHFNVNIEEDMVIRGDITTLVQVINNIVSNAIDAYDSKGGDIDLAFEKKDTGNLLKTRENLVISIKDYGKGIDDVTKSKIFNKMTTTKGVKGTGIGLFVSKSKIKSSFNGDITFNSELGKGTTFEIIIPV